MRRIHAHLIVLVLVLAAAGAAVAADAVFIRDIQADPGKYLNIPVQVRGEVVQVAAEGQPTRGSFMLRDDSDRTIVVRSRDLPAPGRAVVVEGLLSQDPGVTTYFLKELSRCEPSLLSLCGGFNWWLAAVIAAAVVVAGLVVALVLVMTRPEPVAATTGVSTAPAAGFERTRPVSSEEVRRSTPPQATTRLPSVPAQLEVLSGPKAGTKTVLKTETTVGRSNGDLALDDTSVSSEHAKILFENQRYRLVNRSLTNPTRVNGTAIEGVIELQDNDELLMGAVKLKFTLM